MWQHHSITLLSFNFYLELMLLIIYDYEKDVNKFEESKNYFNENFVEPRTILNVHM